MKKIIDKIREILSPVPRAPPLPLPPPPLPPTSFNPSRTEVLAKAQSIENERRKQDLYAQIAARARALGAETDVIRRRNTRE